MRKTKIISTLGPVSDSPEKLKELIEAGVDVFRLNMSHADQEWVRNVVKKIRQISSDLNKVVGILLDTQGPAVRTGTLKTPFELKIGDILEFTVRGATSNEPYSVDVNYDGFFDDVSVGNIVLVDNGVLHMEVLSKYDNKVRCKVLTRGKMGSRRHINLPGVRVNLPPLTEKDLGDIAAGVEMGVDFVALSFCREANDVRMLRDVLNKHKSSAHIIAKIEDQHAVQVLDEIIWEADAIMIARGDLGIECPIEELPIIQRLAITRCLQVGRPVIVATHMLESMIENPVPTRAEITDIANAVFEQADAIMLSGETTIGKYPVDCVRIFDRVARRIEQSPEIPPYSDKAIIVDVRQKTVKAAVVLAASLPGSKLMVFTRRGIMADYVSHLRLSRAPVFAFSPAETIVHRLSLNWNIFPIQMEFASELDDTLARAEAIMKERGFIQTGDQLVVIGDLVTEHELFRSIQLRIAL
ncbi:MAG: pyruvate kinase [Verrucomicrobia bacterium]|nr:MAG: pyruvate kinase [Verrucomicrobiota bacterium]